LPNFLYCSFGQAFLRQEKVGGNLPGAISCRI